MGQDPRLVDCRVQHLVRQPHLPPAYVLLWQDARAAPVGAPGLSHAADNQSRRQLDRCGRVRGRCGHADRPLVSAQQEVRHDAEHSHDIRPDEGCLAAKRRLHILLQPVGARPQGGHIRLQERPRAAVVACGLRLARTEILQQQLYGRQRLPYLDAPSGRRPFVEGHGRLEHRGPQVLYDIRLSPRPSDRQAQLLAHGRRLLSSWRRRLLRVGLRGYLRTRQLQL